jgi:hypothetical protein
MITSYNRGHHCYVKNGREYYFEDDLPASVEKPCKRCGKLATKEGHDACLGNLPFVKAACCGHGVKDAFGLSKPYILFQDGAMVIDGRLYGSLGWLG